MRKNFTYQLLTTFVLAANLVQADKFTLKGGKTIEGEIISESDTEYVISVAYSKSIRTRKTFKKSEILGIEKEAPDLKPFEALKNVLPTGDQLSITAYEQLIDSRVKPFLTSFPNSKHAPEVNKMLATLETEMARAKAGDVKLNEEWIAAADWNANALELDAQIYVKKMKALATRRSYRSALLVYEKINVNFRATDASRDAAEIARKIIPAYSAQIKNLIAEAPAKKAKRDQALKDMSPRDASRMKNAYAESDAKHQAALAKAKETRTKWLPISELDTRTLTTLATNLNSELTSIQREATRSTRNASSSEVYRIGWEAASNGIIGDAKKAQASLRSRKIDPKYIQLISDQLSANPAPEKKKGPTAAELRDAEAAAEAEKEAKELEAKELEDKEKQRKAQEAADAAADAEPEEESSSPAIPIIIALILLGVLVTFLIKKRKESEA